MQATHGRLAVAPRCAFVLNQATQSGGAVQAGHTVRSSVSGSTFAENTAQSIGGAVTCDKCGGMSVKDCNFTANTAQMGGAVAALQPTAAMTIVSAKFRGNSAPQQAPVVQLPPCTGAGKREGCSRSTRALKQVRFVYCVPRKYMLGWPRAAAAA